MQYEPCAGRCYAYSDVMRIHTLGLLDVNEAAALLQRVVAIHEPSCGDPGIQFRLDADEFTESDTSGREYDRTRFVASFYRHGALDLFAADTPLEALNRMIDAALAYYQTPEYRAVACSDHSKCEHGDDSKLVEFCIAFSGLPPADQERLREAMS